MVNVYRFKGDSFLQSLFSTKKLRLCLFRMLGRPIKIKAFLILPLIYFIHIHEVATVAVAAIAAEDTDDELGAGATAVLVKERKITLSAVLEQGLRENPDEKLRQYRKLILDIDTAQNHDGFWYPQLDFVVHGEEQRLGTLFSGKGRQGGVGATIPQGYAGLAVRDYTLFNWGKDYLLYQVKQAQVERRQQTLFEQRLNLKHQLIAWYFELIKIKNYEQIARDYVRRSTFIYRLSREKIAARKIGQQEYYQCRNQYLLAQQEYNQSRIDAKNKDKEFAFIIGDAPDTLYIPQEYLLFKRLRINTEDALRIYQEHNPAIKDRLLYLENAQRKFEFTLKQNMPLPKITVNLGTYLHTFGSSGTDTRYSTLRIDNDHKLSAAPGGDRIEIRAGIDLVWNIFGEKGLFNTRERMHAYYDKVITKIEYDNVKGEIENNIRKKIQEILELEEQVKIVGPLADTAKKQYDNTLDNFLSSKASFIEIKDALLNYKAQEELTLRVKYNHLMAKLELIGFLGVEEFPGENFEGLARKVGDEE
ncbi:MAG: TolC family protein [Oligoflexia bacterium]|nr:TolC family protein [Oligoflexia bacterium]